MTANKNTENSPETAAEPRTESKAARKAERTTEPQTGTKEEAQSRASAEAPAGGPASPKGDRIRKLLPVVGVLVAALGVGGSVGISVLGPKIQATRSAPHEKTSDQGERKQSEKPSEGGSEAGEQNTVGPVLEIENIIVNPAGCQGGRFLMASLAIEVPDEKSCEALRVSEVRLRDEVISILASRTLEMLTRPDARDSIKEEVGRLASKMAGKPQWIRVYLPQFVLQ
jgi:flagellar basal body-associated protein FliL